MEEQGTHTNRLESHEIVRLFMDVLDLLSDEKILRIIREWEELQSHMSELLFDQLYREIDDLGLHTHVKTREEALEVLNKWVDNRGWEL